MKKLLSAVLALSLALTFVACGEPEPELEPRDRSNRQQLEPPSNEESESETESRGGNDHQQSESPENEDSEFGVPDIQLVQPTGPLAAFWGTYTNGDINVIIDGDGVRVEEEINESLFEYNVTGNTISGTIYPAVWDATDGQQHQVWYFTMTVDGDVLYYHRLLELSIYFADGSMNYFDKPLSATLAKVGGNVSVGDLPPAQTDLPPVTTDPETASSSAVPVAVSIDKSEYTGLDSIVVSITGVTQEMVEAGAHVAINIPESEHSWEPYNMQRLQQTGAYTFTILAPNYIDYYKLRLYNNAYRSDDSFITSVDFSVTQTVDIPPSDRPRTG
ncbi:MAG: hypothetical protein LBC82_03735 [Oscillospiraceae bacterium]|nr:hypothetical protein [Oscillospiraceae bacterium]